MKRWCLILVLIVCAINYAHPQPWPKVISDCYESGFIGAYDKGYYIIGPNSNYYYSRVIKTDINGDILWEKKIGNGQYQCILGGIDQSKDGGFVITGQSNKYDSWGDPVIIKFSACGELEWCTVIHTHSIRDYAWQVRSLPDSCYLMLTLYSDPNFLNRIQLFKFDRTGELIWRQNYPPDSLMFAEDSRNLYIDSNYYLISATCYYPDASQTGGGYERPYYIKTDTAGNVLWRLIYGAGNGYHGFPTYQPLMSNTGFFYDVAWHSNFCDTPALIKFTQSGEESYYQDLYPEACPGGSGAIQFLNDTSIVACVGGTVNGTFYLKWIKVDTLGIENTAVYYPGYWITGTERILINSDNKITAISGISHTNYFYRLNSDLEYDTLYTAQLTYDSLCPYPIVSETIDPDCGLVVGIQSPEQDPELYELRAFPNPAKETLTLEIPQYLSKKSGPPEFRATTVYYQWKSLRLDVFDLFGKLMYSQDIPGKIEKVRLDISSWPAGMYVARIVFMDEVTGTVKFVKE